MTARKDPRDHKRKGPRPKPKSPRPTRHCEDCGAIVRRSVELDKPCPHCGGEIIDQPSRPKRCDYERHADRIGAAWTPERVDELLRRNREDAINGQV